MMRALSLLRTGVTAVAVACCLIYLYISANATTYYNDIHKLSATNRFHQRTDSQSAYPNYTSEVHALYNELSKEYTVNLNNVTAKVSFPVMPDPRKSCGDDVWMTVFVMSMPADTKLRNSIRYICCCFSLLSVPAVSDIMLILNHEFACIACGLCRTII